ncbi:membrane protein [Rhodobacter phage RcMenchie]|nr:membrane protein [Rhodobacter phage RcTiptonus]UUV44463.1 membrane protein [Rhodobacter phage RcMenchie]
MLKLISAPIWVPLYLVVKMLANAFLLLRLSVGLFLIFLFGIVIYAALDIHGVL